ncbi:suppressor of tumorigenicity 14 [Caerostris extrusa]|uniref:Suppressor of tumorigenicity 14 n=1 Tax=Caerostris extrusa TaxID=172846 RepID=A0AAV4P1K2_CAEEX|nr:suppressor of tumorigenicity 14 [Caerostris extrusa]
MAKQTWVEIPRGSQIIKESGAEIYCIGITNSVKPELLQKIASDPHDEHVFILQSYATLSFLIEEITNGTIDYSKCGLGLEEWERLLDEEELEEAIKLPNLGHGWQPCIS